MGRNTMSLSIIRRSITLLLTLLVAIGSGSMLMATASWADQTNTSEHDMQNVSDGTLTWGINSEWRKYITGGIANGHIKAEAPATVDDNHRVTWTEATGEINPVAGTGTITYRGSMLSQGHQGVGVPEGSWALDQKFTDIQITLTSPTTAKMSAIVDQPGEAGFPQYNQQRVEIVDLEFTHDELQAGQVDAKAFFTEDGADVFARTNENYQPGKQVDNVKFGIDQAAPPTEPETPVKPAALAVTVSSSTVYEGETVTLNATVTPQLAGRVEFKNSDGTVLAEAATQQGKAQFKTNSLSRGDHTIRAEFTPDSAEYSTAAKNITVSVIKKSSSEGASSSGVQGSMEWGVKESFRNYVTGGIANGKITPSGGAKQARGNGAFTFPQADSGTTWNGSSGKIQYAGNVNFYGHSGVMDVTLSNPVIVVENSNSATLQTTSQGKTITLATIDLAKAKKQELGGDAVRFSSAPVNLHSQGKQFFSHGSSEFYATGEELDRITLTIGEGTKHGTAKPPAASPKSQSNASSNDSSTPAVAETSGEGSAAGSMKWGVSDYFAAYTTEKAGSSSCPTPSKHCAGGQIETSGVGSGWVFPQATGGDWDEENQTGTVNFSGVVNFKGYGMSMFLVSNPSITVQDASTATLHTGNNTSHGKASYPLDLAQGTKTENANGSVTWSNVPVNGSLAGVSASQSIDLDPVTFTVGTASNESFGTSAAGSGEDDESQYEAADTPPTTEGLEVLTPEDQIRQGGRIKIKAEGFDAEDSGVLAVLYENSDGAEPIVLDDTAVADEHGTVEWSGTLPSDATGEHIITLQGSSDAGAEIDILLARATAAMDTTVPTSPNTASSDVLLALTGMQPWEWWASAGSLLSIAGCSTLLVARHRRMQAGSLTDG